MVVHRKMKCNLPNLDGCHPPLHRRSRPKCLMVMVVLKKIKRMDYGFLHQWPISQSIYDLKWGMGRAPKLKLAKALKTNLLERVPAIFLVRFSAMAGMDLGNEKQMSMR